MAGQQLVELAKRGEPRVVKVLAEVVKQEEDEEVKQQEDERILLLAISALSELGGSDAYDSKCTLALCGFSPSPRD